MVVLAAFAIILSLIAGFHPLKEQPQAEMNLTVGSGEQGRIRTSVRPLSEMEGDHFIKQSFDYSCGSAALAILLNFYLGEKFTEKQVIQGLLQYGDSELIAQRRAFSLLDMKKFVNVLGYQGVGYKADIEDLKTMDKPCLVPIKIFDYRHFAVLKGVHKGHVFLTDPWRGDISFTIEEFGEMWYENVIFVIEPQEGGRVLRALRLKEDDLRFIDEDQARQIIFERQPTLTNREERLIRDQPGKFQQYGK